MTISELYEHVSTPCTFCEADVSYCKKCEIGKAIALVNKIWNHFDKYRWHDVRKDPDDMPKEDGIFLVALLFEGEILYSVRPYVVSEKWFPTTHNVIAWKEIEQFEEEK